MSLRIFVVDHGCLAAEDVAAVLRFMGHEVRTSSHGANMLDEALCFRPDLALVDWRLPVAARICRELVLTGTRIAALTSHLDGEHFQGAKAAGVDDLLPTPCSRFELSKLLAKVQDDVYDRQDRAHWQSVTVRCELLRRHWQKLAETVVFRLQGGIRDGQELFGIRAARLYMMLGEEPLHRTFLACRNRPVYTKRRVLWIAERHRYFVDEVNRAPNQILATARSLGAYG